MKKKEYTRQRWWRWWRTEAEITMDEIIWSDYKRLTCTLWIVVYVVGGPHNKAQKGSRKIGLSINTHRRRTDEICRLFFVPVQSFQLLLTHSCALLPFMLLLLSMVFFRVCTTTLHLNDWFITNVLNWNWIECVYYYTHEELKSKRWLYHFNIVFTGRYFHTLTV